MIKVSEVLGLLCTEGTHHSYYQDITQSEETQEGIDRKTLQLPLDDQRKKRHLMKGDYREHNDPHYGIGIVHDARHVFPELCPDETAAAREVSLHQHRVAQRREKTADEKNKVDKLGMKLVGGVHGELAERE